MRTAAQYAFTILNIASLSWARSLDRFGLASYAASNACGVQKPGHRG